MYKPKEITEFKLFETDFVVIQKDNTPLRYDSGEIGLWSQDNLVEVNLTNGEKFLPSNELSEPFKSELIKQLKQRPNYLI